MTAKHLGIALLHAVEKRLFRFETFGAASIIVPPARRVLGTKYASIGRGCFFGAGLTLSICDEYLGVRYTPVFVVGDQTMIGRDVVIACTHSVIIGAAVTVADRVYIGDSYHGYTDPERAILEQPMQGQAPVTIGDGCFIGIGSAILPGVTLGPRCVVGPNAVVTRSFEANTVLLGNPARAIRIYDHTKKVWIP
ncbi:MAG: acyltransferase [Candidatus Eremiobacteraeota bacterium]|nr:acyltransferase [Candidatus Eremiobacteraeota bacterium]MBV9646302.1 acyltransferase [Candidatus Eremiobacteraeota bacterium]